MRRQRQHKRFTISMRNDLLSLPGCYWYPQVGWSTMSIGNENNSKYIRPWFVHEQVFHYAWAKKARSDKRPGFFMPVTPEREYQAGWFLMKELKKMCDEIYSDGLYGPVCNWTDW